MRIWRRRRFSARAGVLALAVATAGVVCTSAPPAAQALSECGKTVFKSNGTPWRCTFADDFSGAMLDSNYWTPLTTKTTGQSALPECRVNSSNNISVGNGMLNLTVRKEPTAFLCERPAWAGGPYMTQYSAGGVSTWQKFSPTYGRFEWRAAFPDVGTDNEVEAPGLHSAIWLWHSAAQSSDAKAEIDTVERRSSQPNRAVPAVHYTGEETDPNAVNYHCRPPFIDDLENFHTYAVEWTPDTIRFIYDGKLCLENTLGSLSPLNPFDQPFFLIMNQSLGSDVNSLVEGVTPLPATMKIDYVRVWK